MNFELISEFQPTGDQPQAIKQLVEGIRSNSKHQVLLGVTGSGKTFTAANVIQQVSKPTLILCHNKTLAAQLFSEFKQFFPNNAVEYFVSYYDYYQPEAFLPTTGTYIEKDLAINQEIEKLRLSTTSALLSGRRDVIVVSSVSCIYGMGNPSDFKKNIIPIHVGQLISRNKLLHQFVGSLYSRTTAEFERGTFRVKGDTVDVNLPYADYCLRILFFGDEIESIETFDSANNHIINKFDSFSVYPANIFVTAPDTLQKAMVFIQEDMVKQVEFFNKQGRTIEAKRLEERVNFDLEMMRELGYCSGIENYSRYFDGRLPGTRPFCLIDYFPDDFLLMVDESHVSLPQVRAMYGGDFSRKQNLVEYGFRLPSALDNRPLKFEEFYAMLNQVIYISATPADFELAEAGGIVVEQLIRPTGILDPLIEVRPCSNQVDDLLDEIHKVVAKDERVLVTTLTKRMAEELTKYLTKLNVRCRYIHSEVDTLERVEILRQLRVGMFDVLIGINLLREGLDLPEVSLVAILDADKEGFLRNVRSLVQTVGRAARNVNGRVIMYADRITDSMKLTMEETERRRKKQIDYNFKHNITPVQAGRKQLLQPTMSGTEITVDGKLVRVYLEPEALDVAADPVIQYMSKDELKKQIAKAKTAMLRAAKEMNFNEAARLRDEMYSLEKMLDNKSLEG
ncbi:MAG: excinuclease ABC subunit UvrB [Bacteroidota bacterium]|nr:excinuclease ABC subunit UvrB [Bacteroidota bacterium]MDP3146247.1 excinuclease ABC subunit UvrB [Bacteroidota bacterium]